MTIPIIKNKTFIVIGDPLVLHPSGIAPIILNLDSWSPRAGFIPILSTKGINHIKKGKMEEKSFIHTKRFNKILKDGYNSVWVQFRFVAFPRLPVIGFI